MNLFSRIIGKKSKKREINIKEVLLKEVKKSKVRNFGQKNIWVVINTNNIEKVLENLPLIKLEKVNWIDGLEGGWNSGIFITEPIKNWVFLVGWGLPIPNYNDGVQPVNIFLNKLSAIFNEAQYFLSQRTTDSVMWVKSVKGEIIRGYCKGDGFFHIEGQETSIEESLKLIDMNSSEIESEEYRNTHTNPELREVLKIAKDWSLSPMEIEDMDEINGYGYLVKINYEEIE